MPNLPRTIRCEAQTIPLDYSIWEYEFRTKEFMATNTIQYSKVRSKGRDIRGKWKIVEQKYLLLENLNPFY